MTRALALASTALLSLVPATGVRSADEAQVAPVVVDRRAGDPGPDAASPLYMAEGFTAPRPVLANCVGSAIKIPDDLVGPVPDSLTAKFSVGVDGTPGAVTVLGQGVPAPLVEAVRVAVAGCRWEPGLDASGTPRAIWVVLPVRFGRAAGADGVPATAEPGMSIGPSGPRGSLMELPEEWRTPERRSFFNRIRQAVAMAWNPMEVARKLDPTGKRLFQQPRTTVLAVTLDPQGAITEVKVARSCGLTEMDKVAMDAFTDAQPFPTPPEGLADERGRIRFTFGFHMSR